MALRPNLIVQDAVVDRDEPAFLRPVQPSVAEVRLGTPLRPTSDNTDCLDARITNENTTSPGDTSRMFSEN